MNRPMYVRLSEFVGRAFIIPILVYLYLSTFTPGNPTSAVLIGCVVVFETIVLSREIFGMKKQMNISMHSAKLKMIALKPTSLM